MLVRYALRPEGEALLLWAALTGGLLSVVCFLLAINLLNRCGEHAGTGGVGMLLISLAAGVGSLRFSFLPDLLQAYAGLARLAAQVGVPLIAVGFFSFTFFREHGKQARLAAFTFLLIGAMVAVGVSGYGVGVAGLSLVMLLASVGYLRRAKEGLLSVAGVGFIVAAAYIENRGQPVLMVPAVALFQLLMTLAVSLLALSLFWLDGLKGEGDA